MSSFPSTFAVATKPLSSAEFAACDRLLIKQLADKGYEVHPGLTREFANTISRMCLQPSIKEYCPNDSGKRFADRAAAQHWLAKGRGVFLLLKRLENGRLELVGYGWAGKASSSQVPNGQTTFALRIGEAGQGQGLAAPFARLIVAAAAKLYGAQDLWLETWGSNGGAVHVYHKIGFQTVAEQPGQRPTPGGSTVADTRVYMSLPNGRLLSE